MSIGYYIVYSIKTDQGTGVGRCPITCDKPIDSMDRIKEVEKAILEDLRKDTPSAGNIFLTFWREIKPEHSLS